MRFTTTSTTALHREWAIRVQKFTPQTILLFFFPQVLLACCRVCPMMLALPKSDFHRLNRWTATKRSRSLTRCRKSAISSSFCSIFTCTSWSPSVFAAFPAIAFFLFNVPYIGFLGVPPQNIFMMVTESIDTKRKVLPKSRQGARGVILPLQLFPSVWVAKWRHFLVEVLPPETVLFLHV